MHDNSAEKLPEGCGLDVVLAFLSRAWMGHILWILGRNGELRFGELRRALPGEFSARVLSRRLRELEVAGLVRRQDRGTKARHVGYALSERGRKLDRVLLRMERAASAADMRGMIAGLARSRKLALALRAE